MRSAPEMPAVRKNNVVLFLDTETTGLPFKNPGQEWGRAICTNGYPRMVSLGMRLEGLEDMAYEAVCYPLHPDFRIPEESKRIHGISDERGIEPMWSVLDDLWRFLETAGTVVGHNLEFDLGVIRGEAQMLADSDSPEEAAVARRVLDGLANVQTVDTMTEGMRVCAIPMPEGRNNGRDGLKYPSLGELYRTLFGRDFSGAHSSLEDARATAECYHEMVRRKLI